MSPGSNNNPNNARKGAHNKRPKPNINSQKSREKDQVSKQKEIARDEAAESVAPSSDLTTVTAAVSEQVQTATQTITPTKSQRERISSLFDGSRENSKPILRVNLFKKCNRQSSNILASIANRKQASRSNQPVEQAAPSKCEILRKVEEVKPWREEDSMNLKQSVQKKLQKAEERRKEQLDRIIRKAHDEDSKVSEIQFINNLEAQNRRHDINSKKKEFEARLQDLQDERQRKFEEKQAKEIAAEERRKTIEAERLAKLEEIQRKRKIRDQKVEQQQQVKEKKRIEKNRDLDQRITAIKEAYNYGVQNLKKRINQKQEQSERRHEINLRHIRQKAFELSIKRYNSFLNVPVPKKQILSDSRQKDIINTENKRLKLKPFNTKKICNLCKDTINSESALFSHLRSEKHHASINKHYGGAMLTTNEAVEIHNLRHIIETDEPLESNKETNSDDQNSSRASSLVNYYHNSQLNNSGGICMTENDRESLLAIEKKCRKLRHKLILAGKPFNRDWYMSNIRSRLAHLVIQHRLSRNQSTITDATSLANTIDLSANNSICQHNKPFYLKITRITRELISITTDQRISGGGIMPAGIIHTIDRLLADLNKQLINRKLPQLINRLLQLSYQCGQDQQANSEGGNFDPDELGLAIKMIEAYAIDSLFLYDIVSCLVSILRRIVPNVSLTSKLPSTVASNYSTLIDPISLNSYYCYRSPVLPARIYIKMIGMLSNLCENHTDLCYMIFHSNSLINLSDILSYRLGFIIGNESPASSISGSSSAATLTAAAMDRQKAHQNQINPVNWIEQAETTKSPLSSDRIIKVRGSEKGDNCSTLSDKSKTSGQSTKNGTNTFRPGHDNNVSSKEDDDDLWEHRNEAETYKRTEDVVDDMTAGLCRLLATVTETILNRPLVLLTHLDRTIFDQRSDDFIR